MFKLKNRPCSLSSYCYGLQMRMWVLKEERELEVPAFLHKIKFWHAHETARGLCRMSLEEELLRLLIYHHLGTL